MENLVEVFANAEDMRPAPCRHGNIVEGHACYCHHMDGPYKCPLWFRYTEAVEYWNKNECRFFEPKESDDEN